jgi:hypothetical protein
VTQCGGRRVQVLFEGGDNALYLDLPANAADRVNVTIWSYRLWFLR